MRNTELAASYTKGPDLERKGPSLGATLTGLEPATSAVTGRHANQLRYRAMLVKLSAGGVTPTGFEPVLPP